MARPYKSGPKQFVLRAGEGEARVVVAAHPQEAYEAFSPLYGARDDADDAFTIEDEAAGQRLVLMPGAGVIARFDESGEPRASYLHVGRANRYTPSAMLFFERGCAGLDRFGSWVADLAELDASPEERGAARAGTFATEAAALEELGRIWADSGVVDPSDRYVVFFDGHGADDDRVERATVLPLLERLGLERVDAPAEAADGEVWVRTDPRLDAELANWS